MKKILLMLMLALSISCMAQNAKVDAEKSESKSVAFMASSGSFMKREFIDITTIKGVEYQILIMTDLLTNHKMGCLRLTTEYTSSYSSSSDTYIGTLDYDELDACIQCLTKLQSDILPSQASVYTEIEYKSRDGVKLGAYYNEKKSAWQAYVYTKGYTSRSASFFNSENIPSILDAMRQAKTMIAERTKTTL
ncbi:MAG: hypothetical protein I3J02_09910 [Prevotella sp.]|nr:hypothetical protein [Prevotella sp.]